MFTYNIQLAGYDYSQYDEKGKTDITNFLQVIEQFPWIEQLEKYDQLQQGCSATVSAVDHTTNTVLWVSAAAEGDSYNYLKGDSHHYLIGYVYPKTIKGFLGLGAEKVKRWVDIYITDDFNLVKELFTLFFSGHTIMLQQKLSGEEKYQSMASKDKD